MERNPEHAAAALLIELQQNLVGRRRGFITGYIGIDLRENSQIC
jgi:hypothetical protein